MRSQQSDHGRQCLNIQYFFTHGESAVEASDDDATQKENRHIKRPQHIADAQGPDQSRRQKTIVQTLIGRHCFGGFEQFRRQGAKGFFANGFPRTHFDIHKIDVLESDQSNEYVGDDFHNVYLVGYDNIGLKWIRMKIEGTNYSCPMDGDGAGTVLHCVQDDAQLLGHPDLH
jgi:hypothetical protein